MVETGNGDFLEYNIYLTRGWGPNMVSFIGQFICQRCYHLTIIPRARVGYELAIKGHCHGDFYVFWGKCAKDEMKCFFT